MDEKKARRRSFLKRDSATARVPILRPFLSGRFAVPLNLAIVAFTVCLAPLPLGSTKPVALGLWCVLLAFAALTMPLKHMDRHAWLTIFPIVLLTLLWAVLSIGHAWNAEHPAPIPDQRGLPIRGAAWQAAGLPLALALIFLTCFAHARDRLSGGRLLRLLAVVGAAYAVLALVLHVAMPGQIFWYNKIQHGDYLTGTFLNRNTAATFFGIVAMIWLARTLTFVERNLRPGTSIVVQLHMMPATERHKLLRALVCLLLCFATVLATGSRAGVFACAMGALALLAVSLKRMALRLSRWQVGLIAIAAVAGFAALLFTGGDAVLGRVSQQGLFDPLRYAIYLDTLHIIGEHFWAGTGPGTFQEVYPAYRTAAAAATGIVNRAHSTPLEIAATMGVPFALLTIGVFLWLVWRLGQAAMKAPRGSSLLSAAFAASLVTGLHSLLDYSLQIPGFAFYAVALLSAGMARSIGRPTADTGASAEDHNFSASSNVATDGGFR
ncbi:hypothetical protein GCM10007276_27420 [Agaricicola taiwanensis]|uniref:O-antigen ligase-related domain-containing protein n=1 Tax=Agaricicola taiwanensis TaxID=591372 RepID=A0A8J2YJP2_9RHOB|nr:O-antigen ligase family protein [Agaricicola taiwanensis]GGE48769.1 hypothetical protein GCM10007276_27420 [Agaricicola taiwanensis]